MENNKLTPDQITTMSEVVAEYMGWKYRYDMHNKLHIEIEIEIYCRLDEDWNVIHEVWDKIRDEYYANTEKLELLVWYKTTIRNKICANNKEQAFTSLYDAIVFINQNKKS